MVGSGVHRLFRHFNMVDVISNTVEAPFNMGQPPFHMVRGPFIAGVSAILYRILI
jgi:hypothetical protein